MFTTNKTTKETVGETQKENIMVVMGIVKKSLLPHLNECLNTPLSEREEKLVSILEIVELEKYVYRTASNQWLGRKLLARRAIARALVAIPLMKMTSSKVNYFYDLSFGYILLEAQEALIKSEKIKVAINAFARD